MCQPDMLFKLHQLFRDEIRAYKAPAISGNIVIKTADNDKIVDQTTQKIFRSGVWFGYI